jgi:hypothetical protein
LRDLSAKSAFFPLYSQTKKEIFSYGKLVWFKAHLPTFLGEREPQDAGFPE